MSLRRPRRGSSAPPVPVPAGAGSPLVSSGPNRSWQWLREVALFAGAYMVYSLARGLSRGSDIEALDNAAKVVSLQADLGLNVEQQVQEVLTSMQVMAVLGVLYLVAQLVAVPLALVVVYRYRRSAYPVFRTTLLCAWLVAIPVYVAFPTAPPRLAGIGIADTVTRESIVPLNAPFVEYFYNPVAAVPSLHAAFAVAVGVGLATTTRLTAARIAALLWGPLVILVVVATGNHFILDVVAGLLVVGVGFLIAIAIHGAPWRHNDDAVAPALLEPLPEDGGEPEEPLSVALVCPYAWDAHGGVAAQVRDMATSLRERGHRVDILAPADRAIPDEGFHPLGGTISVHLNGSVGKVALTPAASMRAVRLIRRGDYDVVHLHEPFIPPCLAILLFARQPLVGTFHMYGPDSRVYAALAPLARIAVRRLHHRTAVSEAARASVSKFVPADYEVIPNGVPRHEPGPRRRDPSDDSFRILFVGRNDPRKGLETLLRAAESLPGARIDLVGVDTEEAEELQERLTPGRPLPATLRAHGRVPEARRREMLDHADVVCAPSLEGESFGLVLVEAMSAGVPVVASSIPGYLDVLAGYGRMVPAGDHEALAAALEGLWRNPGLRRRMGERGRLAARRFEWQRVTPRIVHGYHIAMARQAAARSRRAAPALTTVAALGSAGASSSEAG